MKQMVLPLSLIALAFAGCGESVPPTETVTADESSGGGEVPVDDAAIDGNTSVADKNMANANKTNANTTDAAAGMNDSAMMPPNAAMPAGNETAAAGPKKPPTIAKTISYRCDDKSVVKVDYMSDDLTAMVRTGTEAPVLLKTDKIGGAMTSESGARLSGSGKEIAFKTADGKSLSCKG